MIKIYFTQSFQKQLKKLKSLEKEDVLFFLKKYPHSKNIVEIDLFYKYKVLKCYLKGKKIRVLVLFQRINNVFIPFAAIKKGSTKGQNITKDNCLLLFKEDIIRAKQDIKDRKSEIINFEN